MRQHIAVDQLNELSDKGKEKLLEWWNCLDSEVCPRCGSKTNEFDRGEDSWDSPGYPMYVCPNCDATYHGWWAQWMPTDNDNEDYPKQLEPLLSIGQMIEFLGEQDYLLNIHQGQLSGKYYVWDRRKEKPNRNELCDALWSATKECLEK